MNKIADMWQVFGGMALFLLAGGVFATALIFVVELWRHVHGKKITDSGLKQMWVVFGGIIMVVFGTGCFVTLCDFSVAAWKHVHQEPQQTIVNITPGITQVIGSVETVQKENPLQ